MNDVNLICITFSNNFEKFVRTDIDALVVKYIDI
jgi:hypothetical protein